MIDQLPGYRVLEQVGQGGFGVVYRAVQERLDRVVALKVLKVERVDHNTMRRFQRECRLTVRLTGHPNVVTMLDVGTTRQGHPWVAMEFCEGGSLYQRLKAEGPLPLEDVLRIGVKMAGALAAVHEAGVIHGDIKPQNILISTYGEPALSDFGVARLVDASEVTSHTQSITPAHAAPEVINGRPQSPVSDVYSLASSLYQLLRGDAAFHSDTESGIAALLLRVLTQEPEPITRPGVPPVVSDVLLKAMCKNPDARLPNARAFADRLQRLQAELGLSVTDLPGGGPPRSAPDEEAPAPVPSPPTAPPPPVAPVAPPPAVSPPPPVGPPPPVAPPHPPVSPQPTGASLAWPPPLPIPPVAQPSGDDDPTPPSHSIPVPPMPPGSATQDTGISAPFPPQAIPADHAAAAQYAAAQYAAAQFEAEQALRQPEYPEFEVPAQPYQQQPEAQPYPVQQETSPGRGGAILLVAALVAIVMVATVGVGIYLITQRGKPVAGPPTAKASPKPSLAQGQPSSSLPPDVVRALRPRNVKVTADNGISVKLAWELPESALQLPIVVQQAPVTKDPLTLLEKGATTANLVGLDRKLGYCFKVAAVVQLGRPSTLAWSEPICIRGAIATDPTPGN